MTRWIIASVLVTVTACALLQPAEADELDTRLQVILGPEVMSGGALGVSERDLWMPTSDVVVRAEAGLREGLLSLVESGRFIEPDVAHILEHLTEGRRQYIGVTRNGRRLLHINVLLPPVDGGAWDPFERWRERFIRLRDGGPWCWSVECDVSTYTFENLRVSTSV